VILKLSYLDKMEEYSTNLCYYCQEYSDNYTYCEICKMKFCVLCTWYQLTKTIKNICVDCLEEIQENKCSTRM
jgi:hypothetical protein